jgi:O-antigen/teichoic acid export membrane protein
MAWTRKKALKDITILTISQYVVLVLVVLRGFLFSKYLGPEGFGIWQTIFLIFTYGQYSHLGLFNGASILAPENLGAGKTEEANRYLSSAITWMNIFGIFFFILTCAYAFLGFSGFISSNLFPVMIAVVAVPITFNFNFSVYRLQYRGYYKKAGLMQSLMAVTDLILSFILLMTYGLTGAFIGMIISLAVFSLIITRDGYKDLFIFFDRKTFSKLIGTGFPVLIVSFVFAVLTTSDKLSVANLFSKTEMGFFSNAVSLAMLPYTISMALNGVTTQRMLEEYGKTKDKKSIKLFLDENIFAVAFLIPFFSILLVAFAEPVITVILPKYVDSLRFVDKLSIGVYFLAISMSCYSFLIVIKKYFTLFLLILLLLCFVFVGNSYMAVGVFGLIGVSYISVVNYFVFAFVLYLLAYRNYYKLKKIFWMFIRLVLPVIPILTAFSMKFYLTNSYLRFGARIIIALLWGVFAYYYLTKKTTILAQLIGMVKGRFLGSN